MKNIAHMFKAYIEQKGKEVVDHLEEEVMNADSTIIINQILDSQFLDEILVFCESYVSLLINDFRKDPYFITSFETAFSTFLNRSIREHTMAEILARS